MEDPHPDSAAILDQLKDFQRRTVEHVFERMYVDHDRTRRFLVADEVGLGKTLIARGLIAKAIDHLWDRTSRIDIVYVCSNADIARQNIARLNVTGRKEVSLASRITLLPITIGAMHHRINFVSFTPGTSFDLKDSSGRSEERELLFWLLADVWPAPPKQATRVLEGFAQTKPFRERVERFKQRNQIQPEIAADFARELAKRDDLQREFVRLCESMPRAGVAVPKELSRDRNRFVGELRKLLAQTCLKWLEPDLIILDEFQRFKHLLGGDGDESSDAAQLAEHLFNYEAELGDEAAAARVLLLSATPYKMFTLAQESETDDHYADFEKTLRFLISSDLERVQLHTDLARYRAELFRIADTGPDGFKQAKGKLERSLRRVMVRTERLAVTADRNGMLVERPQSGVALAPSDVRQYLSLQTVARAIGHGDVLEYWKSAPYLLNFMEDYDLKRKLTRAAASPEQDHALVRAVRSAQRTLLDRAELEAYRPVPPANPRLRGLHADVIDRGAWRLLWIPPSLPYYQGMGPFADERLAGFTKRLVFSCWRVVPKAVASVLSYEAERRMMQSFRRKAKNTADARKKRKPLLRFTFSRGRPTGMPALALIYPCRTLAEKLDPLRELTGAADSLPHLETIVARAEALLYGLLQPLLRQLRDTDGPVDERWYWAAPLLLDQEHDAVATREWFSRTDVGTKWSGTSVEGVEASSGWLQHIRTARQLLENPHDLGRPPEDLVRILALLSIAGPGVTALRAVSRVVPQHDGWTSDLREFAAPVAYGFLHLFNLPEVMYFLRDRRKETPYWRSVLEYCAAGNLQSVLDEFAHLLAETASFASSDPHMFAEELSKNLVTPLTLRTTTAQADLLSATSRRIHHHDPIRLRTRFAMRFGDQDQEETGEQTRADQVRASFNSPFWPFVLATTSVGQEGLDFHPYCHAVVHWNLPSNPVDLEQREGRVHRYKGHALRKNIARKYGVSAIESRDPWDAMFNAAKQPNADGDGDLSRFWISDGDAKIERYVPALPHSREILQKAGLRRSLVLYRMAFGQSRQEDLIDYLLARLTPEEAERIAEDCRINLTPLRRCSDVGQPADLK